MVLSSCQLSNNITRKSTRRVSRWQDTNCQRCSSSCAVVSLSRASVSAALHVLSDAAEQSRLDTCCCCWQPTQPVLKHATQADGYAEFIQTQMWFSYDTNTFYSSKQTSLMATFSATDHFLWLVYMQCCEVNPEWLLPCIKTEILAILPTTILTAFLHVKQCHRSPMAAFSTEALGTSDPTNSVTAMKETKLTPPWPGLSLA